MFKRYVASKRHTMQVDFEDYVLGMRQERRRGGRRAVLAGHRLPVPPRAASGRPRDRARGGRRERTKAANRAALVEAARDAFGSSATRPSACATSCAAPASPPARSTTTSPTRRRSSAPSCGRPARRRGAGCGRRDRRRRLRGVRRGRLPRVLRVHRRGPGDVRVPAPQPERARRGRRRRRAPARRRRAGGGPRRAGRARRAAGARPRLLRARDGRVGVELGARMAEREPPDIEGATRFATRLFLGGLART